MRASAGALVAARGSSGHVCWRFNVSGSGSGNVRLSGSFNGDSNVRRIIGRSGSVSGSSSGGGDGSSISSLARQHEW